MPILKESGFSIIEVMIAVVVLAIGLLSVAAMQTKALQGNAFAGRLTEKTAGAEGWMEWLVNFSKENFQSGTQDYIGYEKLAALDTHSQVGTFTKLEVPCSSMETLKAQLKSWGLKPPIGEEFDESQIPLTAGSGYTVDWYIDAGSPLANTTTIKIETTAEGKTSTLVFMVSSHM